MSISNTWENEILDHIYNNLAARAVATAWVSLHDGAGPGETGANEVTGGGYARQSGAFGAAAAGAVSNTAIIDFTNMPAATVTFAGIWSSSTATASANFIWGGALTTGKVVGAGDTFRFAVGNLDVTLD
jgi:hypothetical protein